MIFSVAVSLCLLCFVRESSETLVNLSKISYGYTGGMDNNKLTFQNGVPGYGMKLSCTNCVKIRDNKVVCEVGKVVNVTVTLSKWKAYLNIPFDVSCDTSKNVATTNYLSGTPMVHSVNLSWVVTDPSIDKYIIYFMEERARASIKTYLYSSSSTTNLHTIIKTKKRYYLLENLREKTQYGICVATIDHLSKTGEYRCVEVRTDFCETGPVRDVTIIPHSNSVEISWTKPQYEEDSPSGYTVLYKDSEGTCGEIFISMRDTTIVIQSSCSNKKNVKWTDLGLLTVDNLRTNTLYTVEISPINRDKIRRSTKNTFRTEEGESGPVLDLRSYIKSDWLYIDYKAPSEPRGVVTNYRVVVLQRRGLCEETNTIVHGPKDISELQDRVQMRSLEKCARYSIEVSPINGWSQNGGVGRSSSVVFVSPPGPAAPLSSFSASFVSTNLLRVSWNKAGGDDACPKMGFVVEVMNMMSDSDCAARLLHEEECAEVREISQRGPKCRLREVKRRKEEGGSWTVHLGRQFSLSGQYRVKIWRITDQAVLENTLSVKMEERGDCFTDCYSEVYGGIRSEVDCVPWSSKPNKFSSARNSLCIMAGRNRPWCYTKEGKGWRYCTVPACSEVDSSSGCVVSVQWTKTTSSVTLAWAPPPLLLAPLGYVSLLYNTERSCEQSHIQTCPDCPQEDRLGPAVQNLYHSCWSKNVTRGRLGGATFGGLPQNKEYRVFVVPLISAASVGEVRNISVRTSLARPEAPSNIKSAAKTMTTLSFSWDKQTDYSRWGRQQYYEAVLLKRINSKRVHNEEVEFSNLEVCSEYCVEVYATNKEGASQTANTKCQQTKAPKLGNVHLNDVESGPSLERVLWWRYSLKDNCPRSYRVRYRNKYVDIEHEYRETSDTSVRITNLRRNIIYTVSVRVETNMDTVDGTKKGEYTIDKEFYTGTMRPEIHGYKEYLSPSRELLNISWSFNANSYDGSIFEFIVLVKNKFGSCLASYHFVCQNCPAPYHWTNLNETSKTKRGALLGTKEMSRNEFKKYNDLLNVSFTMKNPLPSFSVEIFAINLVGVHRVHVSRSIPTVPPKLKTRSLQIDRFFNLSFVANETVSLKRNINGTLTTICESCRGRTNIQWQCTLGEVSRLVIELKNSLKTFSLHSNVSCGEVDAPDIVWGLKSKYFNNSIFLSWSVSRRGEHRYVIYYMNKETSLHRYLATSGQSYVISDLTDSGYHILCIATVDKQWRTGKYACSRQSQYPDPVENFTASSTNKEVYLSWTTTRDNDGYIVNVTDPSGRCLTTIINMKNHCVSVKYSCPFPRIMRWHSLVTLVADHLVPETTYLISISAISRNIVGPTSTVVVSTEKEDAVSNIRVSRLGTFVTIQFTAPMATEFIQMKYRLKVTLSRVNMCTYPYKTIYDNIINTTTKVVHMLDQTKCKEYLVEVTPVKECNTIERIERTTSFIYKPNTKEPRSLINVGVTLLSVNLLKVSWGNIIEEDDCGNFGFMVESVNTDNRSDCLTWIITRRTCTKLIDTVANDSKCSEKVYMRVENGVILRKFLLHGQFKEANTYEVKIWRIFDQANFILKARVKYDRGSECYFDCYSTGYSGIRTGTVDGNVCLPWKNFTRYSQYTNTRSNICHMKDNPSNIPWCINDYKGNLINCDIPKCPPSDVKCVPSVVVTPSKTSLTVEWPVSVKASDNIRGYLTLLHNTDHECQKYHIQACPNCIQLLRMSTQTQGLYVSCRSGSVENNWSHKTTFDGLLANSEYYLYVIPLIDHLSAGEVRNVTAGTLLSDSTPFSIQASSRGLNFLHFMWTSFINTTTGAKMEYYAVTLVNSRSNKKSSIRSSQEIAEFTHLDICTKYCLFLDVVNTFGQKEAQNTICTETLAPSPSIVTLDDIPSQHSANISVSWRYSGGDGCAKYYRLQYNIKFLKEVFERTTNDTSVILAGLVRNVFYTVRVRAEVRVGHGDAENNGEFSNSKEFFTGRVNPNISGVNQHLDSSKKSLDISWSLPGDSKGSLFEFVIRVTQIADKCSDSISLVCNNCVDPHRRKYLSSESIARWEEFLKCDRTLVEVFKRDNKFFGNTINSPQTMEGGTLTIFGLNLLGVHKLYEKTL